MLRSILSASGVGFFVIGSVMVVGIEMAQAIAPIEIDVPLPRCENGKPRNANNECPGDGDGVFRLPGITSLSDSSDSCEVPPGAFPVCPTKSTNGDDPYMGDRVGTPPSRGAGTRAADDRGSGRKGQGMWQVCISTPRNPNGRCWGEMSRQDAERIAKSHMDDPDLEDGVRVWAEEIRG